MMFIPNKPEIWQALREKGLEEDARGLTRMTGFGLWMFWVYFAYLALTGMILAAPGARIGAKNCRQRCKTPPKPICSTMMIFHSPVC